MAAAVGRRGTTWRASSGGGGDWFMARREVRSTGDAHGGFDGAVPWPEVPGDGGVPMDMAAALDTLPGATTLSTRQSRPVLEEGVAPVVQLDRAIEARRHGLSTAAARSRGTRAVRHEEKSDCISYLRALLGGRHLDVGETCGRLLRWLMRRSSTSRVRSSGAAAQGGRTERDGSRERVAKLGFSSTRRQG
jgi:hypothetical protein